MSKIPDPLFQIFEQYLLTKSHEDSAQLSKEVAAAYLAYLESTSVLMPLHVKASIVEDLQAEAHDMLIRKMYGVVDELSYENFGKVLAVENIATGSRFLEFYPGDSKQTSQD